LVYIGWHWDQLAHPGLQAVAVRLFLVAGLAHLQTVLTLLSTYTPLCKQMGAG